MNPMSCPVRLAAAVASLGIAVMAAEGPAVAGVADEPPEGHRRLEISVQGRNREWLLFVPSKYEPTKPVPLVIMLHGMGGTAGNALAETGWSGKAEQETFIVAYPEGTRPDADRQPSFRKNPQSWNDGSGRFHAGERNIDDLAFIAALLDRLSADFSIDPGRIFIAGFSNGASMAMRCGAELSDRVAAVAAAAGACWLDSVGLKRGVSLFYVTGTADSVNPLDGGVPRLAFGREDRSERRKTAVQESVEKWARALSCAVTPSVDRDADGVRERRYGPGRDGAETVFITVEGLGHHWAGGISQAPEIMVGKNSRKLDATEAAWAFFVAHPRR